MKTPDREELLRHARTPDDSATLAFAGVIGRLLASGRRPLIRGLSEAAFQRLLDERFPGLVLANGDTEAPESRFDEFEDLVALLLEYRVEASETLSCLCHAIATASMGDDHLWQDMGLPSRQALSRLMQEQFPVLKARNVGDMKWKKFFYRQLCERAEVPICKAPSCAVCTDYRVCFGPEEGGAGRAGAPS